MFGLGIWEIGFIFLVIVLLFGAKSLPDIAKGMAKAFYAFKKELNDNTTENQGVSHEKDSSNS